MYAFIGVGQGGCGILDSCFYDKDLFKVAVPLAINSTTKDLKNLKNIKREYWLGMSKDRGFIDGTTKNLESYIVGGYGQDRDKAKYDAERQYYDLKQKIIYRIETRTKKGKELAVPFAFLFFSIGGGTGSGIGPVIARILKESGIPVIAVVLLPSKSDGALAAKNAIEALNELQSCADSILYISNQKIAYTKNIEALFKRYNDYVGRSIVDLVEGMAMERIDPSKFEGNPPVIDMKDFITATSFLDSHKPGISCLGRSSENARDLLHYIFPLGGFRDVDIIGLVEQAFLKLTLENNTNSEKNLCLIRLPSKYLTSESKMINMEVLRNFLLEKTRLKETHFGVSLTRRNLITATVVLCKNESKDLKELEKQAEIYKSKINFI